MKKKRKKKKARRRGRRRGGDGDSLCSTGSLRPIHSGSPYSIPAGSLFSIHAGSPSSILAGSHCSIYASSPHLTYGGPPSQYISGIQPTRAGQGALVLFEEGLRALNGVLGFARARPAAPAPAATTPLGPPIMSRPLVVQEEGSGLAGRALGKFGLFDLYYYHC